MNVLVTGGAGYIGSAAAEILVQGGYSVTVLDSLVKGYRAAIPAGVRFVQGDIGDPTALKTVLNDQKFDAVMHFAAFIEAEESMTLPGKYFQNNLCNSLQLIESCVGAGIRKFVLSSTAAVYASRDEPLSELSPLGPSNIYGQTKLMVEQALDWYHTQCGLHYAALRYFNAAGALPGRGEAHHPETHLIPLVLQVALGQRKSIHIYGTDYPTPDGTCIRDYIHIKDLISAHLLALQTLEDKGKLVFNLGNGTGYSVLQVIQAARQVTGHPIPAIEAARRPGDAARLVASSERIRQQLGWMPEIPDLRDIVTSAWSWHLSHPNGYAG